ncbi:hypothetical protein A3F06_02035 [candidate division TM6 bacterium RIFCSPHIGHO2_12_FULL_36_22]|nr:MAG: hypothetical protein A3F06_02035 [candidate division TM6 bacterium RIFCSPHIGHO2_12_FULL_36_22]
MHKFYYTFIIGLIFTGGLQAATAQFAHKHTKNGAQIELQEMSPKEAKKQLGYGFYKRQKPNATVPVSVTITNDSNRCVNFSKHDLGLRLVSPEDVKQQVESRARLFASGGILTFLFLICPMAIFLGVVLFTCAPAEVAMLFGSITLGGILGVIAPTTCCGYLWYDEKKSVCKKIVTPYENFNAIQIAPHERLTKIVYVKRKDLLQF